MKKNMSLACFIETINLAGFMLASFSVGTLYFALEALAFVFVQFRSYWDAISVELPLINIFIFIIASNLETHIFHIYMYTCI